MPIPKFILDLKSVRFEAYGRCFLHGTYKGNFWKSLIWLSLSKNLRFLESHFIFVTRMFNFRLD